MAMRNPWEDIPKLNKIKTYISQSICTCSWFVNEDGRYGLIVDFENNFDAKLDGISLKGISLGFESSTFYLLINENKDWEIFYHLCSDVITTIKNANSAKNVLIYVQKRLRRWQSILSESKRRIMSLSAQMGLFSELTFLIEDLIPVFGIEQSLNYWGGPESDKQDFLTGEAIIEIKSYKSSKSKSAHITSAEQLFSPKEPLYLVCYALSNSDDGLDVSALVSHIETELNDSSESLMELFSGKLDSYGYTPNSGDNLLTKFKIDLKSAYAVTDKFPKIKLNNIPMEIKNVSYAIDLNKCKEYEIKNIGFEK